MAVHQRYPEVTKIDLIWHYVRFDEEVRSSRDQKQLDSMISSTVSLIKEIEAATERKDFPTKTSMLCNWCEFKAQCPEYSHQYASQNDMPTLSTTTISAVQAAETVDKLMELKAKKKNLSLDMGAMMETLESQLLNYSKESGHAVVFGKDYKASFSTTESVKIPDKKDVRRYELESSLKELELWDDLQEMSVYKLKSMLKSDNWSKDQKNSISKYLDKSDNLRISLKKL